MLAEREAGEKQKGDRDDVRHPEREDSIVKEKERRNHRKQAQENEEEH